MYDILTVFLRPVCYGSGVREKHENVFYGTLRFLCAAEKNGKEGQTMELTVYRHKVQYYETDQMKVVHHSNYIRWFEEARTDFLEKAGFSYAWMEEQGIIIPVLSVSAEYKAMVHYGEEVLICPIVTRFNGVRLELRYEVRNAAGGELTTAGTSSHCFLDRNYRPLRLKKEFPQVYAMFAEAAESEQTDGRGTAD